MVQSVACQTGISAALSFAWPHCKGPLLPRNAPFGDGLERDDTTLDQIHEVSLQHSPFEADQGKGDRRRQPHGGIKDQSDPDNHKRSPIDIVDGRGHRHRLHQERQVLHRIKRKPQPSRQADREQHGTSKHRCGLCRQRLDLFQNGLFI